MSTVAQFLQRTSTPAYVLKQSLEPWGSQVDDGFERFFSAFAFALGRDPVPGAVRSSDAAPVARAAVWFAQAATQPLQATLDELGDHRNLRTNQLQVQDEESPAQYYQRRPRLRLDVVRAPYGRLVVETSPLAPSDFTERSCLVRRHVLFAKNSKDWDSGEYLFEPAEADSFNPRTTRQFQVYSQVLSLSTLLRDLNRVADVTVGTWPVRIGCGMVFQDPTARLITNLLRVLKEVRREASGTSTTLSDHLAKNWEGCSEDSLRAVFARNGGYPASTNDELKQLLGKRRPLETTRRLKVLLDKMAEARDTVEELEQTLAAARRCPHDAMAVRGWD